MGEKLSVETELWVCTKCGNEVKVKKGEPKPACPKCGGETIKVVVLA